MGIVNKSFAQRLFAGIGAGAFAQISNTVIQLSSLPIFLMVWTIDEYGTWIVLSSIPVYLSMADLGMANAAGSAINIALAQGNVKKANETLHSSLVFFIVALVIGTLASVIATGLAPAHIFPSEDGKFTVLILAAFALLSIVSGLLDALLRATGRYALGIYISTFGRYFEWIAAIIGLVLFKSYLAVAFGYFIARGLFIVVAALYCQPASFGLEWGIKHANFRSLRELAKPSLGLLTFSLFNALQIQGFTLLVANSLGPSAVAIFNTYRTLARIAVQTTAIISHALWAEFSRLYGLNEIIKLRQICLRASLVGFLVSFSMCVVILVISENIIEIWSHGKIQYLPATMAILMSYAALASISHVPRVLMMAINLHFALGIFQLIVVFIALTLATYPPAGAGINFYAGILAVSEGIISIYCFISMGSTLKFLKSK